MTLKDGVSLGIALVALALSLATAWKASIERSRLELIVDNPAGFAFFREGHLSALDARADLAFVNTGGRPAAVTALTLEAIRLRPGEERATDCAALSTTRPAFPTVAQSFAPMVVPANAIAIAGPRFYYVNLATVDAVAARPGVVNRYALCWSITVARPGALPIIARPLLAHVATAAGGDGEARLERPARAATAPLTLVSEARSSWF